MTDANYKYKRPDAEPCDCVYFLVRVKMVSHV